jgi:hypothetical protein
MFRLKKSKFNNIQNLKFSNQKTSSKLKRFKFVKCSKLKRVCKNVEFEKKHQKE